MPEAQEAEAVRRDDEGAKRRPAQEAEAVRRDDEGAKRRPAQAPNQEG
jgi:hypothetical protein